MLSPAKDHKAEGDNLETEVHDLRQKVENLEAQLKAFIETGYKDGQNASKE